MAKIDYKKIKEQSDKAFVEKIIESIENGEPIWRKPWEGDIDHHNPATGTVYKGVNFLRLYLEGIANNYKDNRWMTMKNIKEKGYHLKKGSKGVSIYKYVVYDKKTKKEPDWETIKKMSKKEQLDYINENVFSAMNYSGKVFNGECIEGLPKAEIKKLSKEEIEKRKNSINPKIENIIKNSEAPVFYDGNNSAYYSLTTDTVHLPQKENFKSTESFYSTALHEISHSTGHSSRLNRNMSGQFGSENYAKEELRAELSSLYLSMELGKLGDVEFENSTAYLKNWVSVLKDDYTEFYKASSDAQKISDYVCNNYIAQNKKPSSELGKMIKNAPKKKSIDSRENKKANEMALG